MVAVVVIEKNSVVRNEGIDRREGMKYFLVATPTYKEVLTTKVENIDTHKEKDVH